MKLIGIAHQLSNLTHGHLRELEKLRGPVHPVVDEKLLGRLVQFIPEYLTQIAAVQVTEYRNIFHRNGMSVILFNKAYGFPDVEILKFPGGKLLVAERGLNHQI